MAHYYRTEGVCLRRLDYSNTSQVATFLTRDSGRLSFMAKGATRAPKKGIRRGFDLLERYELLYTTRRAGSLLNLTERTMIESFRPAREALERSLCAYYAAELALNFTAEADPCPALYATMVRSLRRFAAGENLGLSVLVLELAALTEHGSCPLFDECVECGRRLPAERRAVFSPAQGGPLCLRCRDDARAVPNAPLKPVDGRLLALLRSLAEEPPDDLSTLSVGPRAIVSAGRLLRFHVRYVLGKELRMWKYMQDRHLSRTLRRIRAAGARL